MLDKLRQDNAEGTYADVQEVASVAHCLEYRKWGPEETYVLVRVQGVYSKRKSEAKMKFSVTPFQPKVHSSARSTTVFAAGAGSPAPHSS